MFNRGGKWRFFFTVVAAALLSSCVFLHSRVMPPLPAAESGKDDSVGRLIHSPDRLESALGRALAKLPDVKDGLSPAEQRAIQIIGRLARNAGNAGRKTLWAMARENRHEYQYSGSLQGLLWVVINGHLDRLNPERHGSRDFLDYAWNQLPLRYSTPESILRFLAVSFSFKPDTYSAVPPYLFFRNKYGDCTEFTMLAGYLLTMAGYRVQILLSRPTQFYGHASVIFRQGDGLYLMDPSRTALVRIIERRKALGLFNLVDKRIIGVVDGFDQIFGPALKIEDLVKEYGRSASQPVPYRLIDYQDFVDFVTAHHHEKNSWWTF